MATKTLQRRLKEMLLSATFLVVFLAIAAKLFPVVTVHLIDDVFTYVNRKTATLTHRRYMEGNFAPVSGQLSTTDLKVVSGAIPPDLAGTYIRNGPNLLFYPPRSGHHMFDGESFPHRVRFEGGKAVRYDRSWLDTPRFRTLQKYGREAYISFGDMTRSGYFFLAKAILSMAKTRLGLVPDIPQEHTSSHSTSIVAHHGTLLAAVESAPALSFQIGQKSGALRADPAGPRSFQGAGGVEQQTVFSAHPKICPRNGDLYFVAKTPPTQQPSLIGFNRVSRRGELLKSLTMQVADAAGTVPMHVHDFWLTEHFAIFYDLSVRTDIKQVLKGGKMFSWHPEDRMRLGVVPRDTNSLAEDVIWCDTGSPGHIWHVINGWETNYNEGGTASIALFAPKFDYYPGTIPIHTPEEPPSYLTRWDLKLDLSEKHCTVAEKRLRDEIVERPSTNLRFHGSPRAKWGYLRSEGTEESGSMGGTFLKVDLTTGELAATFVCSGDGETCVTGEALYVPKSAEATREYPFVGEEGVPITEAEDDGYLVDMVYYPSRNESELVLWDATASGLALPIARVELPERVPYGVHAWFAPPHLYSSSF